jgi:peptide/nickel transport system substrate-binding protein
MYYVSFPIAYTTQGLLDLNLKLEPSTGIATEWEASKDLLTYTFKLRKEVLCHNGREVDAAAVQWNYERIMEPAKSHEFTRSALLNLQEVLAPDTYTVVCKLEQPSAAFPADVVFYPCNLMAPDSKAQADTHPIGCGPFKFVTWERYAGGGGVVVTDYMLKETRQERTVCRMRRTNGYETRPHGVASV